MKKPKIKAAISAAFLSAATGLSAAARPLPTPPTSPYPDAESSICVPLNPARDPFFRLGLAADFAPSNAVIVAFGTDADNDGDLSPEETDLRVGCDCEEWLAPNPLTLKLGQWNLAKLTTHNLTSTNLVVTLSRIGTTILVR